MTRIVTLTPSPAIDVSTTVARLKPTEKLRCGPARRDPGGGGVNVARVAGRLGGDATAVYPSGGPTGELLDRLLAAEGTSTRPVRTSQDTRENFFVLEEASGDQFKFILPGPALDAEAQARCVAALDLAAAPPAYLVCSGGLPDGVPAGFYAAIARAAKAVGTRVVVDTYGPALPATLAEGVHLVKPSLEELNALVGRSLDDEQDRLAACRALVAAGQAEMVALSLGAEGALLVTEDGAWRASAPKVSPLSTVGAGDSFLAALLIGLSSGAAPGQALRQAVAAGAAALLDPGTGLCRPAEMTRLAAAVAVRELASRQGAA